MLLSEINFGLLKNETKIQYERQQLELIEKNLNQDLLDNIEELVNNGCIQQLHLLSEKFQSNFQRLKEMKLIDVILYNNHNTIIYIKNPIYTILIKNRCEYLLKLIDSNCIKKLTEIYYDDSNNVYSKEDLHEFESILNNYHLIRELFLTWDYLKLCTETYNCDDYVSVTPLAERLIDTFQQKYLKQYDFEGMTLQNIFNDIADKINCKITIETHCWYFDEGYTRFTIKNKDGIFYEWIVTDYEYPYEYPKHFNEESYLQKLINDIADKINCKVTIRKYCDFDSGFCLIRFTNKEGIIIYDWSVSLYKYPKKDKKLN